jgi:hypothetical protein
MMNFFINFILRFWKSEPSFSYVVNTFSFTSLFNEWYMKRQDFTLSLRHESVYHWYHYEHEIFIDPLLMIAYDLPTNFTKSSNFWSSVIFKTSSLVTKDLLKNFLFWDWKRKMRMKQSNGFKLTKGSFNWILIAI